MSKVKGLTNKDFFELVEQMNEFSSENKVYATQVFPYFDKDGDSELDFWYALIYYDEQGKDKGKPYSQPPSPVLEKASKEQIDLLYKLEADFNEEAITKKEAWVLTNQLIKERGKKK